MPPSYDDVDAKDAPGSWGPTTISTRGLLLVTADAPVVITSWTFGAVGTVPTTVQARPADPTMKRR